MPNLEEMSSKFSSQLSVTLNELEYYNNPNIYHDSNDEINFIPIQEKSNSNCVRWKYHIKHHSTNKKLRCSNFLIIWSQPTKINPVPKATAEMWMIYYHTSNVHYNINLYIIYYIYIFVYYFILFFYFFFFFFSFKFIFI